MMIVAIKITNNKKIYIKITIDKERLKMVVILSSLFIMLVFLFVGKGGGEQQNHRLIRDLWDAGHLVFFAMLVFSYFKFARKDNVSILNKLFFTTVFCIVFGTAIEVIQSYLQRGFSRDDIINDLIGGYLGLLSLFILSKNSRKLYRNSAIVVFVLLLMVGLRDFGKNLYDELYMRRQFPMLANFETQLELDRWEFSGVNVFRTNKYTMSGDTSLKVIFLPGRYPTISLQYLEADWSNYEKLVFSVFNPNHYDLKFELKLVDKKHRLNGGHYNDRFNKNITFKYGWNIFEVSINSIMNGPKQRLMNIDKISSFSLFTDNLKIPTILYIDSIHLE